MMPPLPRGEGLAIFAGGGDWLPRTAFSVDPLHGSSLGLSRGPGDALVLSAPAKVMTALAPDDIPALLDEVEREQKAGRYVAGYLAYEAGAAFGLTVRTPAPDSVPLAWMAAYDQSSATRVAAADWKRSLDCVDVSGVAKALEGVAPALNDSPQEYTEAIRRVREYIAAGDTYQVNYTVRGRYALPLSLDPLDYFLGLIVRQPVPYAAYLDLGDTQVLSLSPELFLRRDGHTLRSRPMKGTRPRGSTHVKDVALAYELAETVKERAENLMIVDMVRNDLGRVCRAGGVRVPTLFAVEPYRTVWQMVSTVVGAVNPRATLTEIMRAVFPGASITGAPKHHTMEIIAELETEPREVYTGAVGLFSPGGDFAANIAIRTITHRQGRCKLGVGSGVVWDADAGAEYEETLAKAAFASPPPADAPPRGGSWRPDPAATLRAAAGQGDFYLFETVLLNEMTQLPDSRSRETGRCPATQGGGADLKLDSLHSLSEEAILGRFAQLAEHLDRMADSALALGLPFDPASAREVMTGLGRLHPEALVVRVQVDAAGTFSLSTREAPAPPPGPVDLMVSPFRTDPDDPLLRHKTSLRGFYNREHRRALSQGCFDALFVNRLGQVTEGAITNLFARFGSEWVTPPLTDGLLPGIWRAQFARLNKATQASLGLDDLSAADELLVGNSVRGAVPVARLLTGPLVS
jgi:para-aminobenzoate synthetase/4-amino-4-deoxychorismate lyase